MKPYISILCPTMRVGGVDLLLHGLAQQTMKDFELVLCDALWSRRKDLVAIEAQRLGVQITHVEPAQGRFPVCSYCRHMNTALVHARGEIVVLIVDYTWMAPDNLERHATFHRVHGPGDGLMGPHRYKLVPPLSPSYKSYDRGDTLVYAEDAKSGKLDSVMYSIFKQPFNVDARTLIDDPDNGIDAKRSQPAGPCHSSLLHCKNESTRLSHLVALNGFDEDLDGTHGWQDSDIADRLTQKQGVNWTLDPTLMVEIVNPRHVFPFGLRERPYMGNEAVWKQKKADGYPPVNSWSIADARKLVEAGEAWPQDKL